MEVPKNCLKRLAPGGQRQKNAADRADPDQLYQGAAQSQWDSNNSPKGVKADRQPHLRALHNCHEFSTSLAQPVRHVGAKMDSPGQGALRVVAQSGPC